MNHSFSIVTMDQITDQNGAFYINPGIHEYNVLQPAAVNGETEFPAIIEDNLTIGTMNTVFLALQQQGLSLCDLVESRSTRLFGLNKFIAQDASGNPVPNMTIKLSVIFWMK